MDQYSQIDDACGPESEYVLNLKSRLRYLEDHHRQCELRAAGLLQKALGPSLDAEPYAVEAKSANSQAARNGPKSLPGHTRAQSPAITSEVGFINYTAPPAEAYKSRICREAKAILDKVPKAKDWISKWKGVGVTSWQLKEHVVTDVLGHPSTSTALGGAISQVQPDSSGLRRYAAIVGSSRSAALRAVLVASFQELLLVSACIALGKLKKFDEDTISDILRIGISDSSWKNHRRLMKGVLWANKLIFTLSERGWGMRAAEIFFFCKRAAVSGVEWTDDSQWA